jgi:multidrug efflux pump
VFGLGFSTMLTLIVTPVWLAAPAKLGRWRDRMINRLLGREAQTQDDYVEDKGWAEAEPDIRPAAE